MATSISKRFVRAFMRTSQTDFGRLARVQALATMGDSFVTVALAGSLFFNISPAQARVKIALSLLLTVAPFAVVAPFLGPLMDSRKSGRRLMVVGSAAGRSICCLFMASVTRSLTLFPIAFVSLVLAKAHGVAKSALVPGAVESKQDLVDGNSKLSLISVVAGFVAAPFAVGILKLAGPAWTLRSGALIFALATFAAVEMQATEGEWEASVHGAKVELLANDTILAAVAMGILRATVGFLTFLLAFAFRRSDESSWWFGAVVAASMAGSFLGALIAPRLRKLVHEETIIIGALLGVLIGGIVAQRSDVRQGGVLLAFIVGLAAGGGKLAFDSLVQRESHATVRGRSFARLEAAFQLAWVLGALLPVAVIVPARVGYTFLSLASGAVAAVYTIGHRAALRILNEENPEGVVPPDLASRMASDDDTGADAAK